MRRSETGKLSELPEVSTHDCRLTGELTPSSAPVGFFREVEAILAGGR